MKKIKVEMEVSDDFEKGFCYNCPFSYWDSDSSDNLCVFYCKYDECPIMEIKE